MAYIIDNGILKKYLPEPGETEITLPEDIQIIEQNAFSECNNLYFVHIPEGITSIQEEAFRNCKELIFIKLPGSLRKIGKAAFESCESLEKIIIPEHVDTIPERTFQGCTNLRSVILPQKMDRIGGDAFRGCSCLTSVVIPDGIKEIKFRTFSGCHQLHFVMIPESVQKIELIAFSNTTTLQFKIRNQLFKIVYSPECQILASAMCQPELMRKIIGIEFIRKNDNTNLKLFLECGFVTTGEQIDEFIRYAIELKNYESQVILMNYKREHIGYQSKNWNL